MKWVAGLILVLIHLSLVNSSPAKTAPARSKPSFVTNSTRFYQAPAWLKKRRVQKAVSRIQNKMEWSIRRVNVTYHSKEESFRKMHHFGPSVRAIALKKKNEIHLGPRVNISNFEAVFGHELVHIILYQKYKHAIPRWLEEGMANYLSGERKTPYHWLASRKIPAIETMTHPFSHPGGPRLHYTTSTAVMEMIAYKCDLPDLLQLSVGKRFETYLRNTCGIRNLQKDFETWLKKKARRKKAG